MTPQQFLYHHHLVRTEFQIQIQNFSHITLQRQQKRLCHFPHILRHPCCSRCPRMRCIAGSTHGLNFWNLAKLNDDQTRQPFNRNWELFGSRWVHIGDSPSTKNLFTISARCAPNQGIITLKTASQGVNKETKGVHVVDFFSYCEWRCGDLRKNNTAPKPFAW